MVSPRGRSQCDGAQWGRPGWALHVSSLRPWAALATWRPALSEAGMVPMMTRLRVRSPAGSDGVNRGHVTCA